MKEKLNTQIDSNLCSLCEWLPCMKNFNECLGQRLHSLKYIDTRLTHQLWSQIARPLNFDHNELFALQRLMIELEALHISEVLKVYILYDIS